MTLAEMAHEKLEGQRIALENHLNVFFTVAYSDTNSRCSGVLEVLDTYNEKYLLAYQLISNNNEGSSLKMVLFFNMNLYFNLCI